MAALRSVIDPATLRWIWLTHTDFDHIGSLLTLVEENPHLRVITSFLGVGIMGLSSTPLPMDRVHLINAGQSITVGDRRLTAVKPPTFDNPITTGFLDDRTGALFSSDCFGAILPEVPENAADLGAGELRAGQIRWASVDSPWLHDVDRAAFGRKLDQLRATEPSMVYSSHLPPAPGSLLGDFVESLAMTPDADQFNGPDQAALEAMLAGLGAGASPVGSDKTGDDFQG